jgi:SMC interacting uncharacterized protein involved in chromosome segregation
MRYKYETPKTNARWETLCCSGQSWYQIADEMKLDCRQLERELTAVTEQRDGLHELHNKNAARSKELLELCGTLRKELTAVTEQRDRLAEAVNAATILIAAKGRHNTMLAYNGLRDALQSLTPNDL